MLGFRVWDKLENKFIKFNRFFCDKDGDVFEFLVTGRLNDLEEDRFIPMQSTGLRDKNGVMIFEGDILSTLVEDKYVLVTETIGFAIFYGDGLVDHKMPCFAVIGNRFENPELLEKVKK